MASERESPGVADLVVTALSPALIMLMVGSLVFFLVEVLYAGKYTDRLLYTLFFFVFAAVLVARISIQYDAGRAAAYGIALAVVTYIAILAYVEYPTSWLKSWGWLLNLILMTVIWWSAHKLTWDCTHIDEKRNASGQGLLTAAGLDADERQELDDPGNHEPKGNAQVGPSAGKKKLKKAESRGKAKRDSRLWDWIEKYKAHREAQRKGGHAPGVWVLYFALAALPLFALGQSLVAPDDDKRRWNTFIQMAVYIGSALGLLVTTSLLGVRRYLRQRKAKIPGTMTATWLGFGGLLIIVFLALGAFLPRPHSEVPWFGIERAGKSDREASKYAQLNDSAGKGDGRGGSQSKSGDGSTSGKGGQPGGTKGEKGSGKGDDGKGGDNTGKGEGGDSKGSEAKDGSASRDTKASQNQQGNSSKEDGDGTASGGSHPSSQLGGALAQVASVVKWIVFAIIAILIVFGLFFGVLRYLAPFTAWAQRCLDGIRNWWASLFGKSEGSTQPKAGAEAPIQGPLRPPPFHAYSNPFADGSAERRDTAELIAYTFEALDAWAWDRDAGREPTETPLEFARRLAEAFPDQAEAFSRLATLYTRLAYSTLPLPEDALALLEGAWEQMVHGSAVGA